MYRQKQRENIMIEQIIKTTNYSQAKYWLKIALTQISPKKKSECLYRAVRYMLKYENETKNSCFKAIENMGFTHEQLMIIMKYYNITRPLKLTGNAYQIKHHYKYWTAKVNPEYYKKLKS